MDAIGVFEHIHVVYMFLSMSAYAILKALFAHIYAYFDIGYIDPAYDYGGYNTPRARYRSPALSPMILRGWYHFVHGISNSLCHSIFNYHDSIVCAPFYVLDIWKLMNSLIPKSWRLAALLFPKLNFKRILLQNAAVFINRRIQTLNNTWLKCEKTAHTWLLWTTVSVNEKHTLLRIHGESTQAARIHRRPIWVMSDHGITLNLGNEWSWHHVEFHFAALSMLQSVDFLYIN